MILALKLLLTPLLIAMASLAGRRWGPGVSGWLIGFPLTSGPVSVILALQYGSEFASRAAIGNLAGLSSICIFCLVYTLASRKLGWAGCSILSAMAFLLSTLAWDIFTLSLLPTILIALSINALVIRLIPRSTVAIKPTHLPKWDLPVRMSIATLFVFLLTTFASLLGPQLSGLITPYPVFATVLVIFAHRQQGVDGAIHFLRGHVISLIGFAAFFLVVSGLLTTLGIFWTYILASLASIAVNGKSLRLVH